MGAAALASPQIILWHAYLALMDWDETLDHLRMLAAALGTCHLVACQAVYELNGTTTPTGCNGTTLRRCHIVQDGNDWYGPATDDDPAVALTLLDFARRAATVSHPPERFATVPTTSRSGCSTPGRDNIVPCSVCGRCC